MLSSLLNLLQIKDDICRQQGYTAAEYDLCFRLSPLGPVKMTSDLSLTVRQLLAAPHGRLLGKEQPAISMLLSRRAQQVRRLLTGGWCGLRCCCGVCGPM